MLRCFSLFSQTVLIMLTLALAHPLMLTFTKLTLTITPPSTSHSLTPRTHALLCTTHTGSFAGVDILKQFQYCTTQSPSISNQSPCATSTRLKQVHTNNLYAWTFFNCGGIFCAITKTNERYFLLWHERKRDREERTREQMVCVLPFFSLFGISKKSRAVRVRNIHFSTSACGIVESILCVGACVCECIKYVGVLCLHVSVTMSTRTSLPRLAHRAWFGIRCQPLKLKREKGRNGKVRREGEIEAGENKKSSWKTSENGK